MQEIMTKLIINRFLLSLLINYCLVGNVSCSVADFTNCPVSNLLTRSSKGKREFNSYPLVFYDGSQINPYDVLGSLRQTTIIYPDDSYQCEAYAFARNERELLKAPWIANYNCSDTLCPVSNSDLRLFSESYNSNEWTTDGMNMIGHQRFNSLCNLALIFSNQPAEGNKIIVRLFIIGGSVAFGVGTKGFLKNRDVVPYGEMVKQWLMRKFNDLRVTVKFHNFAYSGFTSDVSADQLYNQLADAGYTSFTTNDIILIDNSMNDYKVYDLRNMKDIFKKAAENLIRKILFRSEGIGPSIYFVHSAACLENTNNGLKFFNKNESLLSEVYLKVANHYGLGYLSYLDLVWNPNTTPFRTLLRIGAYGEMHPPWHVHLHIADMIARSIEIDMEKCNDKNVKVFTRSFDATDRTIVPKILFNSTKSNNQYVCDKSIWYANSRKEILYSETSTLEKSNISWSSDSWKLKEDRKGKPGWISEIVTEIQQKHVLDFKIRRSAPESIKRVLTFNISLLDIKPNSKIGLYVYVMKTYKNAGEIKIHFCDEEYFVETLWEDFKTFHVTMPALYTKVLQSSSLVQFSKNGYLPIIFEHVWKEPSSKTTQSIRRELLEKPNSKNTKSFHDFTSKKSTPHNHHNKQHTDDILVARGNQKVKLLSIELCTF